MILESESGGDRPVDLNDGSAYPHDRVGNPKYDAVSPDGLTRISGYFDGVVGWVVYFVERWNGSQFEFADELKGLWSSSRERWTWTDNDTAIFFNEDRQTHLEMTIIAPR